MWILNDSNKYAVLSIAQFAAHQKSIFRMFKLECFSFVSEETLTEKERKVNKANLHSTF